jgi:hypothetical protein
MKALQHLWRDEAGSVICSELVLVGTLGVLATSTGMSLVARSVNEELKEFSFALRSLDQSYAVRGYRTCGAYTAGSCYTQPPVKQTLAALEAQWQQTEAAAESDLILQPAADGAANPPPADAKIPEPTPKAEKF